MTLPINQIIHGDCLEVMKTFPDRSVDLVLTDPPYGLGIDGNEFKNAINPKQRRKAHEILGWDNAIPSKEYFDEMFRTSKNQVIWGGITLSNISPKDTKAGWSGTRDNTDSQCQMAS